MKSFLSTIKPVMNVIFPFAIAIGLFLLKKLKTDKEFVNKLETLLAFGFCLLGVCLLINSSLGIWWGVLATLSPVFVYIVCMLIIYWRDIKFIILQRRPSKKQDITALSLEPIKPLSQFLSKEFLNEYEKTGWIEKQMNLLKNYNGHIRLLGLSGTGKTRLLYETFKSESDSDNIFFCDTVVDSRLMTALETLININPDKSRILILDNCTTERFIEVLRMVGSYNKNLKVIASYNIPIEDINLPCEYSRIVMDGSEMTEMVGHVVDANPILEDEAKTKVKDLASGNCELAQLLMDAYQVNRNVFEDLTFDDLMYRILGVSQNDVDNKEFTALKSLAMFQPLGYDGEYADMAKFVIENSEITPIVESCDKRLLLKRVVNKYKEKKLIEQKADFINIRPLPLAAWLAGKWLQNVGASDANNLLRKFKQCDIPHAGLLKESFGQRIKMLGYDKNAREIVEEICNAANIFHSEEVIFSPFGSQLFLLFSTVSPKAVAKCLYEVISSTDTDTLRENLIDKARRNIVYALEKLCYPVESFEYAAKTLAIIALAENEDWSNNATGVFCHLFQILIPGTQADLKCRYSLIEYIWMQGETYKNLTLRTISAALGNGTFYKDGGAENFGYTKKIDFNPTTNDVIEYWTSIKDLLLKWMKDDDDSIDRIGEIVAEKTSGLCASGFDDLLYELFSPIAEHKQHVWEEMRRQLWGVEQRRLKKGQDVIDSVLDKMLKSITPNNFKTNMMNERKSFVYQNRITQEGKMDELNNIIKRQAEDFVKKGIYDSKVDIYDFMDEQEFISPLFHKFVCKNVDDEQLSKMISHFKVHILHKNKDYHSRFVMTMCRFSMERDCVKSFIIWLKENEYIRLHVAVLADGENGNLTGLKTLIHEFESQPIVFVETIFDTYVKYVNISNAKILNEIVAELSKFDVSEVKIYNLLSSHVYDYVDDDNDANRTYKSIVLHFLKNDENLTSYYNIAGNLHTLLERGYDDKFAIDVAKVLIDRADLGLSLSVFDFSLHTLLEKYKDNVWHLFADAIQSSKYFLHSVYLYIGSGHGFGEGPFFTDRYKDIKELCKKYPDSYPEKMALMCPVFDENEGQESNFHPFVYWLLENYGNQKDVLNNLGCNIGSFGWTGSVIPLYKKQRNCFLSLLTSSNKNVREWTQRHIAQLDVDLKYENNSEAYQNMHYE